MNRIDTKFAELKRKKKKAFIAYITAGDPDLKTTYKIALELAKNGVDLVELGIPFSDPLADGPTIQAASQRALKKGITIRSILRMARSLRKKTEIPFVFMTYYNPIYQYGLKKFVDDSKRSGVDGVIVPDLPPEEAGELLGYSQDNLFSVVFLAAPTSTNERLKTIAKKSGSFIYYVSLTGVTGARKTLSKDINDHVKKIKRMTSKPVCVGFGVSNPRQARLVSSYADGVIIGSALIKVIEKNIGRRDIDRRLGRVVRSFARAIKK
ncbi:MAG: tryptophan synthase subunit alpha [Candidatus Omnitrophica bacterium]|nr:tryptophan synthase subunit alpha [Candidatus Omnitrophota bacterium]